ncbi:MAG: transcriptional regulator [Gammaproteobacteria bacterium]|nr:transcriptional regulator [Gammaproteobacteria bacterium]
MDGAAIATARKPVDTPGERRAWGQVIFSRQGAAIGYGAAALLLLLGWFLRDLSPINAGEGVGYALGIIGGSLMLVLLLYSMRKRVRFLRRFGATKYWFRIHMMLGIVGPLLILYHCNFNVGSLNSQVALYCTLLVAASGIVGRYLYAQIHLGLYGRKASLRQLTEQLKNSNEQLTTSHGLIRDVRQTLVALGDEAAEPPATFAQSIVHPVVMGLRTRWWFYRLNWAVRKELTARAMTSEVVEQHRDRLLATTREFLDEHLTRIRRVAQFGFYERLFAWWHIVHVPFFLMMVLSGIVHVLAVHMY